MRLVVLVVLAGALLVACGGVSAEITTSTSVAAPTAPDTTAAVDAPPTTRAAPTPETTSTTRSPAPHNIAEIDLVAYIDVIEHMLIGTAYEGKALEAPHVFLATGSLFCDELDAGVPADQILFQYIETLTGGSVDEASDDDLTMAGAVLGSGLAALCPHNIAAIGEAD